MARRSPQKAKAAVPTADVPRVAGAGPTVAALARRHAEAALAALIEVVGDHRASPAARISAASALLNWGFGKPNAAGDDTDNGPAELVIRWRNAQDGPPAKPASHPRPRPKS